jgi:hypothetical protein
MMDGDMLVLYDHDDTSQSLHVPGLADYCLAMLEGRSYSPSARESPQEPTVDLPALDLPPVLLQQPPPLPRIVVPTVIPAIAVRIAHVQLTDVRGRWLPIDMKGVTTIHWRSDKTNRVRSRKTGVLRTVMRPRYVYAWVELSCKVPLHSKLHAPTVTCRLNDVEPLHVHILRHASDKDCVFVRVDLTHIGPDLIHYANDGDNHALSFLKWDVSVPTHVNDDDTEGPSTVIRFARAWGRVIPKRPRAPKLVDLGRATTATRSSGQRTDTERLWAQSRSADQLYTPPGGGESELDIPAKHVP